MEYKVFLGVGHGGVDSGAVGYVKEKDVNLQMALACRDYLEDNGVKVKMSRTKDENDDLKEEIRECNAYDPDLAVDIHNNSGGGDGFEAYYSIGGGKGKTLAKNIETEIKAIGQNSRGCKIRKNSSGNDYYGFIRQTYAPAVIVEGVFVDNKKDASQADTLAEQKAFGVAYAKGILKTLGVSTSNKPTKPKNDLEIDGYFGKATVKATQKWLGTVVDGIVSRQPKSNKKYLVRAVDSVWKFTGDYKGGSLMVKALQKKVGATADGYMGKNTVKALQKYLNKKGYKLEVDGYMGVATVKAMQKHLNNVI